MKGALAMPLPPCARKAIVQTIRTHRNIEKTPWFPTVRSFAAEELQISLVSLAVDIAAHHEASSMIVNVETTNDKLATLWFKYYKGRIAQDIFIHITHDINITLFILYTIAIGEWFLER